MMTPITIRPASESMSLLSARDDISVTKPQTQQRVRGVGLGIPYVETFSQQKMRELWEHCEFQFAYEVLNDVITESNLDNDTGKERKPPLCKIEAIEEMSPDSLSGYEHMFDPLYDGAYQFIIPPLIAQDVNDKLKSFCLRVAYRGDAFCGWQTQRGYDVQPSVQKTLETYLNPLFLAKKGDTTKRNKSSNLHVAGRTDAGVHAIGQICRFRTHRQDVTAYNVQQHVSEKIAQGSSASFLKVTDVVEVPRAFHPTFGTSSRAYVYLIDVPATGFWSMKEGLDKKISFLNRMLLQVEGKELDYFGLSYGRPQTLDFLCTLHHARARLVVKSAVRTIGDEQNASVDMAICIELVGSRFLRRMVRLLVQATMSIVAEEWRRREKEGNNEGCIQALSVDGLPDDAFLRLVQQRDRSLVSRVSPPNGLLFVGAKLMDS